MYIVIYYFIFYSYWPFRWAVHDAIELHLRNGARYQFFARYFFVVFQLEFHSVCRTQFWFPHFSEISLLYHCVQRPVYLFYKFECSQNRSNLITVFSSVDSRWYLPKCTLDIRTNSCLYTYLTLTLLVTQHKHLHYNLIWTDRCVSKYEAWIFYSPQLKNPVAKYGDYEFPILKAHYIHVVHFEATLHRTVRSLNTHNITFCTCQLKTINVVKPTCIQLAKAVFPFTRERYVNTDQSQFILFLLVITTITCGEKLVARNTSARDAGGRPTEGMVWETSDERMAV